MKNNIFKLFLGLAIIVRFVFSATSYHQDTGTMLYLPTLVCWFGVLFSFDILHFQTLLKLKLILPGAVCSSSFFKEIVQLSRAGLVATLFLYLK